VKRVYIAVAAVVAAAILVVAVVAVRRSQDDGRSHGARVAQLVPFSGESLEAVRIRTASGWRFCGGASARIRPVLPILAWRRFRPLEELAAYGLAEPALVVELEHREGGRLVIHLGASNADDTGVYSRQVPGEDVYLIDPDVAATIEGAVADCLPTATHPAQG
jgi:hypothetical protein